MGQGRSAGRLGFVDSSTGVGATDKNAAFRDGYNKGHIFLSLGNTPKIVVSFEELRMRKRHLILCFSILFFLKKYYVSALLL